MHPNFHSTSTIVEVKPLGNVVVPAGVKDRTKFITGELGVNVHAITSQVVFESRMCIAGGVPTLICLAGTAVPDLELSPHRSLSPRDVEAFASEWVA